MGCRMSEIVFARSSTHSSGVYKSPGSLITPSHPTPTRQREQARIYGLLHNRRLRRREFHRRRDPFADCSCSIRHHPENESPNCRKYPIASTRSATVKVGSCLCLHVNLTVRVDCPLQCVPCPTFRANAIVEFGT